MVTFSRDSSRAMRTLFWTLCKYVRTRYFWFASAALFRTAGCSGTMVTNPFSCRLVGSQCCVYRMMKIVSNDFCIWCVIIAFKVKHVVVVSDITQSIFKVVLDLDPFKFPWYQNSRKWDMYPFSEETFRRVLRAIICWLEKYLL